jgi:hypothetical protein
MRWLGLVPLIVACSHPAPVAKAPPPLVVAPPDAPRAQVRLFSDDEITAYETEMLAKLSENAKRSCPGPNGTIAGRSASEIRELVESTDDCMKRLATVGAALKNDFATKAPDAVAIDKDCGERIAAAMHHAAAFQDGCSPYQVGVGIVVEDRLGAPIQIAHLLGYHASVAKDPAKGIAMLLDALRAEQDLARGHVSLISSMVSVASLEILAARLDEILESAKLPKAKLDDLAKALDQLIAGAPNIHMQRKHSTAGAPAPGRRRARAAGCVRSAPPGPPTGSTRAGMR